MEKQLTFIKKLQNPFLRIAGAAALGIGLAGICLNSLFCWLTDLHFQGLLHISPAPTDAFGVIFAEHLIIWLIPAFLFYLWGRLLSRSKIRIIDVWGTTAFAQLPLLGIGIFGFFPAVQHIIHIQPSDLTPEWFSQSATISGLLLLLISLLFLIWTLIWMFKALKISCNLKSTRLGIAYTLSVILGDIVAVYLIHLLYT